MKAFSSHSLPLPIEFVEGFEFYTIVMMRHPLLRVRSVYDFELRQPENTPGSIHAKKLSFCEYVEWRMRSDVGTTIRNMHVRYLTANSLPRVEKLTDKYYESALNFIQNNRLTGIVELFDQSAVVFDDYLASNEINIDFAYKVQNQSSRANISQEKQLNDLKDDLGGSVYELLLANNELDLRLYEEAKKIVVERYRNLPGSEVGLDSLRKKCNEL